MRVRSGHENTGGFAPEKVYKVIAFIKESMVYENKIIASFLYLGEIA